MVVDLLAGRLILLVGRSALLVGRSALLAGAPASRRARRSLARVGLRPVAG
jgi:hypothetical protein